MLQKYLRQGITHFFPQLKNVKHLLKFIKLNLLTENCQKPKPILLIVTIVKGNTQYHCLYIYIIQST